MSNYGIFNRLGFPSSLSANTTNYSNTTINTMNTMPNLLTDWQMQDIANSNVNSYFVNPCSDIANNIITSLDSIETLSTGVSGLETIKAAANNILMSNTLIDFREHTDRLSGVSPPDFQDPTLPHYEGVIAAGKILSYLLYQSDGISNNAAFIGNFGSIIKYNTLGDHSNTINSDVILIDSSIITSGETPTTSLTSGQKTTIISNLNTMNTFIETARTDDIGFYANCSTIINEYKQLKGFNGMGQTQTALINDYIGSDKLLSRLNP